MDQNPEDLFQILDVVLPAVNPGVRAHQFQEPPVGPGGDGPIDRPEIGCLALVEALCSYHRCQALSIAPPEVIILGLNHGEHRRAHEILLG